MDTERRGRLFCAREGVEARRRCFSTRRRRVVGDIRRDGGLLKLTKLLLQLLDMGRGATRGDTAGHPSVDSSFYSTVL